MNKPKLDARRRKAMRLVKEKYQYKRAKKLTETQVREIYELKNLNCRQTEVAEWYGISVSMVSHIWNGRYWNQLTA